MSDCAFGWHATELRATLEYDFFEEKKFSYKNLAMDEIIHHLALFVVQTVADPYLGEGNTRTTAVFFIKCSGTLGLVIRDAFLLRTRGIFQGTLVQE